MESIIYLVFVVKDLGGKAEDPTITYHTKVAIYEIKLQRVIKSFGFPIIIKKKKKKTSNPI